MAAQGTQSRLKGKSRGDEAPFSGKLRCARLARLDPSTLDLVAGSVETVCITVECHLDELANRIRGSHEAESVGERVRSAVEHCRDRGLELEVELPFAVENAAVLAETVAWLADAGVEHIRVVPHPPRLRAAAEVDPHACLSRAYIDRVRSLTEEAA